MINRLSAFIAMGFLLTILINSAHAGTLQRVQEEGVVRCGIQKDLGPALSNRNTKGEMEGFFVDISRAIAAAVVGDPGGVEFVPTSTDVRFDDLRSGRFDVLVQSATFTMGRDCAGLEFMPLYLFDGQGFLYYKPAGEKKIAAMKKATICVEKKTTSEANLHDYNSANGMGWTIRTFNSMEGAFSAFFDRQCDAISTDALLLASMRQTLAPNPADYPIAPERISKEPLCAVVRSDDAAWADVVRWVVYALINAEELGVTSKNLDEMKKSKKKEVRRLLGIEGDLGKQLGLNAGWAERAIRAVGNYGEIFERNLSAKLGMERGFNRLWSKGGLIWAPPMR